MKRFLREYFTFSNQTKTGLLVLVGILLVCIGGVFSIDLFVSPPKYDDTNIAQLAKEIDAMWENDVPDSVAQETELARFDPNRITEADWKSMGIDDKVIKSIMNYQKKGGHFYRQEDVLKIYSFTKEDYLRLVPFIAIESARSRSFYAGWPKDDWEPRSRKAVTIEINTADSADWTSLNGIGPVLAMRILKYRDLIDGFTEVNQVGKAYGLSPETFESIKPSLFIDTTLIRKKPGIEEQQPEAATGIVAVEINTADSVSLDALPGIGGFSAQTIIRYRKQLGGFATLDQLKEVRGLRPENLKTFSEHLFVDTTLIIQLDLNRSPHTVLSAHPYISNSLADFIVSYRQRTPFQNLLDLRKSYLVDEGLFKKLRPYLTCKS